MSVPYWIQDAVFYQIFPDRFAKSDVSHILPGTQKWGSAPTVYGFQGGNLRGIIQHMDYLLDLGITALYLNPIFESPSNHRYNTSDYFSIDPKLGTLTDFTALLDTAHRNNMRVILDGVFNHCGRGFSAFVDVLENGQDSLFTDWFHISKFPLDAYGDDPAENYQAWWKFKSLPKFNTSNEQVRQFIFDVARHWINIGADGWRLDVPNEIDDDRFWEEFRRVVKNTNRDAYLVGEIWTPDPRWVNDKHFDGVMHYPVRDAFLKLLEGEDPDLTSFAEKVEHLLSLYPRENAYAMYVPSGSHDTERLFTTLKEDIGKTKLFYLFQMAYPGAPAIYYGDEIGLDGGKDPECRKAFPWKESNWQVEIREWVKRLIALRKRNPALRRGDFKRLVLDKEQGLYGFTRSMGEESIIVILNFSKEKQNISIPCKSLNWGEGRKVSDLLSIKNYTVSKGNLRISLPPWSGTWIA